jgi:hypothetical protein
MTRRTGFTIMEILIAITILLVGIVGVISLFPVAIKVGGDAIADSLAANLARSVEEAIRAAMKHRKVAYVTGADRKYLLAYFIYEHDGVLNTEEEVVTKDPVPADPLEVKRGGAGDWGLDCVVLLPCDSSPSADPDRGYGGRNAREARRRAYMAGKVFVYPEGDPDESKGRPPANGGGDPRQADDDKDDFEQDYSDTDVVRIRAEELMPGEDWPLRVTRTFRFGPRVLGGDVDEELGGAARGKRRWKLKRDDDDPYRQYSYAFAIRRAYEDSNVCITPRRCAPGNDLFEVKVMIFRAFMPETRQARPIYTTSFLVSR